MQNPLKNSKLTNIMQRLALILGLVVCLTGCTEKHAIYQPAVAQLIQRAGQLKNSNQVHAAICRMEAAADLAPSAYPVQYNLAVLYSNTQQWVPAIEHLNQAVALDPKAANAWYTLGIAHEELATLLRHASTLSPIERKPLPLPKDFLEAPAITLSDQAKTHLAEAKTAYERFLETAPVNDPARSDVLSRLNN
jgi:tetratricopeptide (TPR) repeat protein